MDETRIENLKKINFILEKCLICTEYYYFLSKKVHKVLWDKLNTEERMNLTIQFLLDSPEYLNCIKCIHISNER